MFGQVKAARQKETGIPCAIKIVKKRVNADFETLRSELTTMLKVDHYGVANLFAIYETEEEIFIVMEMIAGGNLRELFIKHDFHFSEFTVAHIMKQLVGTLVHLGSHDIVHRDIKPENLMVEKDRIEDDQKVDIKMVDFGLASVKPPDKNLKQSGVGSRYYMAPELINKSSKGHDLKVDVWAVGVLCF